MYIVLQNEEGVIEVLRFSYSCTRQTFQQLEITRSQKREIFFFASRPELSDDTMRVAEIINCQGTIVHLSVYLHAWIALNRACTTLINTTAVQATMCLGMVHAVGRK